MNKASKTLSYWIGCCFIENVWNLWNKHCRNLVGPGLSPLPPAGLGHPQLCWLHAWSQGNIYKWKKPTEQIFWLLKYCWLFFSCAACQKLQISHFWAVVESPVASITHLGTGPTLFCKAVSYGRRESREECLLGCFFGSQLFEAVQKFGILEVDFWPECNWSC